MHHTARLGLGFDEVDALTGPKIGRPKSATYRTADVVGLDTLAHVIGTMDKNLADDPWHRYFKQPEWLAALISKGALGQKSGAGVYRKAGREIQVLDLKAQDYRPSAGKLADEVGAILANAIRPSFAALRASSHPQAQFLWSLFRDIFHYSAAQLANVADNARDLTWPCAGLRLGPGPVRDPAGRRLATDRPGRGRGHRRRPRHERQPRPPALEPARQGVHAPEGSYSARSGSCMRARPCRCTAARSIPSAYSAKRPTTVASPSGKRRRAPLEPARRGSGRGHPVGHLQEPHAGRRGAGRHPAGRGPRRARVRRPGHLASGSFAVGANLQQVVEACAAGQWDMLEATVEKFQRASQAFKYAQIPTVAAVQGMALGGGCEFLMHASHRVLALESYIGLVEAGVGLIPAGGGSKEFAGRAAALAAKTATPGEVFPFLQPIFQTIATAQVAKSAREAIETGFAREQDIVLFHPDELLFVAIGQARAAAQAGYVPPARLQNVPVAGRNGIANFEMMLVNMREGGMMSAHDYRVARSAAVALCGGEIETGTRVDEEWLLTVERKEFVALLRTPETQARIRHTLETGKPLRN